MCPRGLPASRGDGRHGQKSAEAIVGAGRGRRAERVGPRVGRSIMKPIGEAEAAARRAGREATGRNPGSARVGAEVGAATNGRRKSEGHRLMEQVVKRSNMQRTYSQVMRNCGAPGIDGLRTQDPASPLAKREGGAAGRGTCRARCAGWTSPSRKAWCGPWACPPWWTD